MSLLASMQENVAFVGDYGGWVDMAGLYEFLEKFPKGTPQKTIAETMKAAVGTPQESPDIYSLSSPLTYVELINGSVLIIHGEKDNMVPVSQSRVLYEKLKQLGRDVELHVIDSEYLFTGHEKELFENPLHPYTKSLISAYPPPDPTVKWTPVIPDELTVKYFDDKCRYIDRCPLRTPKCEKGLPELIDVNDKHKVRCVLYT